jgi:menaquinone reductase, iron-sulfur cluster-binding subunit
MEERKHRFGMVIDLDKCNGCGACMVACAVENNVPPAHESATERTGITWLRVQKVTNGEGFPDARAVFIPMMCQQCEHHTPCVSVCPQNAVEVDEQTGIVFQMPERCLGCRYCMTACPYHARSFNWRTPEWPEGMEKTLNPDVSPRMRGVVEKCNLCHGRYQAAKAKAAMEGRHDVTEYVPACVEACPTGAITFGDLADKRSAVSKLAHDTSSFRFLEKLGNEPKVHYRSKRAWVRALAEREPSGVKKSHG